jgi:hypothetical protein
MRSNVGVWTAAGADRQGAVGPAPRRRLAFQVLPRPEPRPGCRRRDREGEKI